MNGEVGVAFDKRDFEFLREQTFRQTLSVFAIEAFCNLSPVVLMIFNSKRRRGNAARHIAAIMFDCASASALPRVQMMMGVQQPYLQPQIFTKFH